MRFPPFQDYGKNQNSGICGDSKPEISRESRTGFPWIKHHLSPGISFQGKSWNAELWLRVENQTQLWGVFLKKNFPKIFQTLFWENLPGKNFFHLWNIFTSLNSRNFYFFCFIAFYCIVFYYFLKLILHLS